jgi:hypothetical protein
LSGPPRRAVVHFELLSLHFWWERRAGDVTWPRELYGDAVESVCSAAAGVSWWRRLRQTRHIFSHGSGPAQPGPAQQKVPRDTGMGQQCAVLCCSVLFCAVQAVRAAPWHRHRHHVVATGIGRLPISSILFSAFVRARVAGRARTDTAGGSDLNRNKHGLRLFRPRVSQRAWAKLKRKRGSMA